MFSAFRRRLAIGSPMRGRAKNGRHALVGMLRQAVFGRLAGYEDVNDPTHRRIMAQPLGVVGGKAIRKRGVGEPDGAL